MTGKSRAQQAYELLEPDRQHEFDATERRARQIGDRDAQTRLATLRRSGMSLDEAVTEMYRLFAGDLRAAMVEFGHDMAVLDAAVVGSTVADDITAQIQGFPDGSALISVSDGISSLSHMYNRHISWRIGALIKESLPRRLRSVGRIMLDRDSAVDERLLAGTLRYHNVHQRVFGNRAKVTLRLDEYRENLALMMFRYSMMFVIAHELAHHALGHLRDRQVLAHTADPGQEAAADKLAFSATVRVAERDTMLGIEVPAFGALAAVVALRCAERALFVRPGATHPPAARRGELIMAELSGHARLAARVFFDSVITATDVACDFTPGPPKVDWNYTLEHGDIYTPHPATYLNTVIKLDRIQSLPPGEAADVFDRLDHKHGTAAHDGALAVLAGRATEALVAWGVPDAEIPALTDPATPLTFHTLQSRLYATIPGVIALGHTTRRLYAVVATTMITELLAGKGG